MYGPTIGPIIIPVTPVAQSVQIGTGLSGQTITHPTTSFTSRDTFAFVIQLRTPANTNQALAVIFDQTGTLLYYDYLTIQPSTTIIATSFFGPLGEVMKEPPSSSFPATPPAGTYTLSVFLGPLWVTDYANHAWFTYTP